MTTIRDTIRRTLVLRGITQAHLARVSGVPQQALSEYLSGKRDIRTATADRLCRALGLELRRK